MSSYSVYVTGIEFYGYHGVPAEERVIGHRYRVDVEMMVKGRADRTDKFSDTVDYALVAELVTSVGTVEKAHTVERLAYLMGERILVEFKLVEKVLVRVAKPFPPAPVIAEEAGVEIEIER